jgi:hypothetical protein
MLTTRTLWDALVRLLRSLRPKAADRLPARTLVRIERVEEAAENPLEAAPCIDGVRHGPFEGVFDCEPEIPIRAPT